MYAMHPLVDLDLDACAELEQERSVSDWKHLAPRLLLLHRNLRTHSAPRICRHPPNASLTRTANGERESRGSIPVSPTGPAIGCVKVSFCVPFRRMPTPCPT